MTLVDQQGIFSVNLAKLILYMDSKGYKVSGGEWWRTPEMAKLYAERGSGIKLSLHCDRIAADLVLRKDGVLLTHTEAHRPFGLYWATLHPLNRWGGDWDKDGVTEPGENDGNHYEMRRSK